MTVKLLLGCEDVFVTVLTGCVWTDEYICLTAQPIIKKLERGLVILPLQMTDDGGLTCKTLGMPADGVLASQDWATQPING